MAAHRSTRHEATGYTPNHLVFGREVCAPVDIIFETPNADRPFRAYDTFVKNIKERSVAAVAEVQSTFQRCAESNKKYYDLGLKPNTFKVGQRVMYFNTRKLQSRQIKWLRPCEGPFLIVKMSFTFTAKIQRTPKATPKTVHIDKLKDFVSTTPRSWIDGAAENIDAAAVLPVWYYRTAPLKCLPPEDLYRYRSFGGRNFVR